MLQRYLGWVGYIWYFMLLLNYLPHYHSCHSFPCCAVHNGCSGGQRCCCVPHDVRYTEHPHELHRVSQSRNLMPRRSLHANMDFRRQYIAFLEQCLIFSHSCTCLFICKLQLLIVGVWGIGLGRRQKYLRYEGAAVATEIATRSIINLMFAAVWR